MSRVTTWTPSFCSIETVPDAEGDQYGSTATQDFPPGTTLERTFLGGRLQTATRWDSSGPVPVSLDWYTFFDVEVGLYLVDTSDTMDTPPHTNDVTLGPHGWIMNESLQPEMVGVFEDNEGAVQIVQWSLNNGQVRDSHAQRGPTVGDFPQLFFAWHYAGLGSMFNVSTDTFSSQLTGELYLRTLAQVPS